MKTKQKKEVIFFVLDTLLRQKGHTGTKTKMGFIFCSCSSGDGVKVIFDFRFFWRGSRGGEEDKKKQDQSYLLLKKINTNPHPNTGKLAIL